MTGILEAAPLLSIVAGIVSVAIGGWLTLKGTRLTAAVDKKEADISSWTALSEAHQAEITRLGKEIASLKEQQKEQREQLEHRIEALELERALDRDYIEILRRHIYEQREPPPPDRPK